jgi:hypothetical protein
MEIVKKIRDKAARFVVKKAIKRVAGGGVAEVVFLPYDLFDAYRTATQAYDQMYVPFSEHRAWVEAKSRLDALSNYVDAYLETRERMPNEVGDTYGFSPDDHGKNLLYYAKKAKTEIAGTSYEHKAALCETLEGVISDIESGAERPQVPTGFKGLLYKGKEKISPDYTFPVILTYNTCALLLDKIAKVSMEIDATLEAFKVIQEHQKSVNLL